MIESATALSQFDDPEFQAELRKIVDHHMSARRFLDLLTKMNSGAVKVDSYTMQLHTVLKLLKRVLESTSEPAEAVKLERAIGSLTHTIDAMESLE